MRVLERSVYRGPHLYSETPMVRFMLDLGAFEGQPTNTLDGFADALLRELPGLEGHGCNGTRPGGLVARLREGTWLGHVIEHVALELQAVAGHRVTRGKTRSVKDRAGVYNVMYAYRDEAVGLAAGRLALETIARLLPAGPATIAGLDLLGPATTIDGLRELVRVSTLGPTTQSIVDASERRGIPWQRLDEHSLVRLGQGSRQKLVRASITGETSHVAVESAGNKELTKSLLSAAGIPVPRGSVVTTADAAVQAARRIGARVVTKPLNGNHGRGVSVGLEGDEQVRAGFDAAAVHSPRVIVEERFEGRDYRVLVIGGRMVAAAERVIASVTGDGATALRDLVAALNADPRRGRGHERVMTRVNVTPRIIELIAAQGFGLDDVIPEGHEVVLGHTSNLSAGGEAIDRTNEVHPDNVFLAERAARVIGLDVAGLDILSPDLSLPLRETGGGIVEVNAAPGFRMHLQPSKGESRDVAEALVRTLYPHGSRSVIPITSVTGTNGKSTTVRMIGHILAHAGYTPGVTSTTGVYVGERLVRKADASGPKSARLVLGDPMVDAAVLETARGGLLREGLAYRRADVGIVLNVAADHLGLKGVDTLDDLASVKSVIVRQVKRRGTSVLNADDPRTRRMARRAGGTVAFFTLRDPAPLLERGGPVAALEPDGTLVIYEGGQRTPVMRAEEIPATLNGAALFNVQNALAAILAARAHRIEIPTIAAALRDFAGSYDQNPGRLNVTRAPGFATIVDYAHNPAALRSLGALVDQLRGHYARVIGVVSIPGDRRDEDILEVGSIAAGIFDDLIFRERPDGRGRAAGGVMTLLTQGAEAAGMTDEHMQRIMDEPAAMQTALTLAGPDDLVVLLPTDVDATWQQVQNFRSTTVARRKDRA